VGIVCARFVCARLGEEADSGRDTGAWMEAARPVLLDKSSVEEFTSGDGSAVGRAMIS